MGNNNKGRELMRIQSQVSDMLAAVGDYIDRFDVRVDEEGYHIVVGLCVSKNSTLDDIMCLPEMGSGMQIALERVRECANAMAQSDEEEEVVQGAVELQIEEVVSPRFTPAVASNGIAEQPKEKRPVVRRYQQINHVPLTRDGIKSQLDKEED